MLYHQCVDLGLTVVGTTYQKLENQSCDFRILTTCNPSTGSRIRAQKLTLGLERCLKWRRR
ncbi:hypothetical protein M758_9G024500 [Ceratodon purpureus]|nr:hypothetical protein M758_9G024500 [Ceratodon purpureus]